MRCPFCKDEKGSKVLDSREASQGTVIRRRRECLVCERRFTTYERMEVQDLQVIKTDDTRQPFEREKILKVMELACKKLKGIPKERLAERLYAWRDSGATTLLVSTQQPEALRALAEIAL